MGKLLRFLKGYEKESVLGPLFKLLEATLELFVPLIVASLIYVGIANRDLGYVVKMFILWQTTVYNSIKISQKKF